MDIKITILAERNNDTCNYLFINSHNIFTKLFNNGKCSIKGKTRKKRYETFYLCFLFFLIYFSYFINKYLESYSGKKFLIIGAIF